MGQCYIDRAFIDEKGIMIYPKLYTNQIFDHLPTNIHCLTYIKNASYFGEKTTDLK